MSKRLAGHQVLYAIIRVNPNSRGVLQNQIKVTKIVYDQPTAQAEVDRLNTLNGGKGAIYFWQTTHSDGPIDKVQSVIVG